MRTIRCCSTASARSIARKTGCLPLIAEVRSPEGMQAMTHLPDSRSGSLLDRINTQHAWDLQHGWKTEESTYPPATEEQLRASEQALGFLLPPLLRTLYAQVANGGFGPDL